MSAISVDVSYENGSWVYKSSSNAVLTNGDITVEAGDSPDITFAPAPGQTWTFVSSWITIDPTGGHVSFVSGAPLQVVIHDDNPKGPASEYDYCLQTSIGPAHPRIINKGGGSDYSRGRAAELVERTD